MPPVTNNPITPTIPNREAPLPTMKKQTIAFANNREATAVFPSPSASGKEIIEQLGIKQPKSVLLVIGGADSLDEKLGMRLTQLFGRGIARAATELKALVIDGGTEAGVMKMMGQGVADRGYKTNLLGVAPRALVQYPGSEAGGEVSLDPNHSHFVLVDGQTWGSETGVIFKLMSHLTTNTPSVVLLAGGGEVSKNECLQAVRQRLSLMVLEGSGGAADEIAAAWKAKPSLPDDPLMAEIVDDGRIELYNLNNSVRGAERVLMRALGGDNVLMQAWERFADYDFNAILQQQRYKRQQNSILLIGLIITALAIFNEIYDGNLKRLTFERWWPGIRNGVLTPSEISWTAIHYLLLAAPIIVTILITAANRFKQGNKWLLLRSGAEGIKREIYKFRTRAEAYGGMPAAAPPDVEVPTATVAPPTAEQVLAQRVEDITRRVMRTEVNSSVLVPYKKELGFPPYMEPDKGGDDGFSTLAPDRYVQVRLEDQFGFYRKKALKLERQVKWLQWSVFIIGGLGTFLAAINRQVWIALTTAAAAAITTYLSYQQTEETLMKYNQAATDLENVKSWWMALPADEQARAENVNALVNHTESVLQTEQEGWVQRMQDALAQLREAQVPIAEPKKQPQLAEGEPPPEDEPPVGAVVADVRTTPVVGPPPPEVDDGEPPAEGQPPVDDEAPEAIEPTPEGEVPPEGEALPDGEAPPDGEPSPDGAPPEKED